MAMAQPQEQQPMRMSEAEYLEFEETSETRHEFVDGEVYAMAGAGINHNIINGNVQTTLNTQVNDDCIVVSSDMRLKVASKKVSYRYPDTMVICGDIELVENRTDTITNPIIVVEVLSPSTALKDFNEKKDEYLKIHSIQDYVIISQHEAKIEVYSRLSSSKWSFRQVEGMDASIELPSIACMLDLPIIYAKTKNLKTD
ncbi:MAG: Uma2 family endonuclease [Phototrophicaceae bacterium]